MNQLFIKILFQSKTHRKIEINKKIVESTIHRRHLSLFGAKHTKDSKDFACSMLSLLILSRAFLSKKPTLGAGPNFRIQRASFFKKNRVLGVVSVYQILRISDEFASTFKNKQISDEFDPNFKNKQFRRIRHFSFNETKSVEFVGTPPPSLPSWL